MPTPLPTLPRVYYGQVWGTYLGRRTGVVVAFKAADSATTAAFDLERCGVIAQALTDKWNDTIGPMLPNAVLGWDSRVYGLEFPTNPAATAHTTGHGAGGVDSEPTVVTVVIKHSVLRRGRGSQSHTSISPLIAGTISGDGETVNPGPVAAFTAEWGDFIGEVQAAALASANPFSIDYVQLSKKGSGATYPIVGSFAETIPGTERSRTARP
jgi:hypothetical protein